MFDFTFSQEPNTYFAFRCIFVFNRPAWHCGGYGSQYETNGKLKEKGRQQHFVTWMPRQHWQVKNKVVSIWAKHKLFNEVLIADRRENKDNLSTFHMIPCHVSYYEIRCAACLYFSLLLRRRRSALPGCRQQNFADSIMCSCVSNKVYCR